MTENEQKELDLLREVHHHARGILRYSGEDEKAHYERWERFKEAVYAVNEFDQEIE